jgi:ankyrin repeat protein
MSKYIEMIREGKTDLGNIISRGRCIGNANRVYSLVLEILKEIPDCLNSKCEGGWTLLHSATATCYPQIVKMLIKKGIDINVKNNEGHTALAMAERYGFRRIIDILKENNAQ